MKHLPERVLGALLVAACSDDIPAGGGGSGGAHDVAGAGGDGLSSATTTSDTTTIATSTAGGSACDLVDDMARASACSAYAIALCGYLDRCNVGWVESEWGGLDGCEATLGAWCIEQRNVVEERYLGCIDAVAAAVASRCDLDPFGTAAGDACDSVGVLAEGEQCSSASECTSGFCRPSEGPCGRCAPPPAVGDPCSIDCGDRLTCIQGQCADLPREGDRCPGGALGLCDDGSVCAIGTCTRGAAAGEGEPCDHERWCTVEERLVCVDGTCERYQPGTAGEGAPCEPIVVSYFGVDVHTAGCAEGLRCDFVDMRCRPLRLPGDACESPDERTTNECRGGVCDAKSRCTCPG